MGGVKNQITNKQDDWYLTGVLHGKSGATRWMPEKIPTDSWGVLLRWSQIRKKTKR